MKYDLSVILPAIRPLNWRKFYDSILQSFSGSFELIIITPFESSSCLMDLKDKTNIKHIQDWGSPARCQQIGLNACEGKYISWGADDGEFMPGALDIAVKSLEKNPNSVVVGKYNEGEDNPEMDNIQYYYPSKHEDTDMEYVPKDCLMCMEGVIPRDIIFESGGWETRFDTLPMCFIDLSIRLYNKGIKFIFQQEMFFKCSHMPGMEGDHGPIHMAQTYRDVPLFKVIYSSPDSKKRMNIPLDNWEKSAKKWARRFKD